MKSKEEIEKLAKFEANNDIKHANIKLGYQDGIYYGFIEGYTQCQEDMANDFLLLIEEYREKELPDRNVPYHYEAEISSGLNALIEFIKNKNHGQDNH
jgi:hypothetical protein